MPHLHEFIHWKKTVFLKKSPSDFLPKIKYGISKPYIDILHWNFSCSSTFDISVNQEGGLYNSQGKTEMFAFTWQKQSYGLLLIRSMINGRNQDFHV